MHHHAADTHPSHQPATETLDPIVSLAPRPSPIAEIAFNLPLERSFHYSVPALLASRLKPGMRVLAPFGSRIRMGYVLRWVEDSPLKTLKAIERIVDPIAVIAEERWALASWLSEYYCCSLGEALAALVPAPLRLTERSLNPIDVKPAQPPVASPFSLTPHQQQAIKIIIDALKPLRARPFQEPVPGLDWNRQAINSKDVRVVLLHGVTGSGKTELYLQAITHVLDQKRSTICLVPEIALTPQTVDRFRERFGSEIAVWHSRLTQRQRTLEWRRMVTGECRIVIGARSAIFAPVTRLGLILLDEEHERSYKQEDTPRYHTRDVALARAWLTQATVLLGSATPSIESAYHAKQGSYKLASLPDRVAKRPLPRIELIDMREELTRRHRAGPVSNRLIQTIQDTIQRKGQVMLLLNRRGFARSAQCQTCGMAMRCAKCSVPLVYHASRQALVCHYCGFQEPPPELCPACQKGYLRFRGSGTEGIESQLHRLFPTAAIARMDRDTTRGRESHRQLYEALKTRQIGLLIGTQMIAKGFDLPHVTLVGILSADTALNIPDFRSGEFTFHLLTQMAGRSGRGDEPGLVLIQTFCPTHYAIQSALQHDYERFYAQEIEMRQQVGLPPFSYLIELTFHGSNRLRVQTAAEELSKCLRQPSVRRQMTVLGPAPHRIPKIRGQYQVCVLLKGKSVPSMVSLLRQQLQSGRRFQGVPITVDVNPL